MNHFLFRIFFNFTIPPYLISRIFVVFIFILSIYIYIYIYTHIQFLLYKIFFLVIYFKMFVFFYTLIRNVGSILRRYAQFYVGT